MRIETETLEWHHYQREGERERMRERERELEKRERPLSPYICIQGKRDFTFHRDSSTFDKVKHQFEDEWIK